MGLNVKIKFYFFETFWNSFRVIYNILLNVWIYKTTYIKNTKCSNMKNTLNLKFTQALCNKKTYYNTNEYTLGYAIARPVIILWGGELLVNMKFVKWINGDKYIRDMEVVRCFKGYDSHRMTENFFFSKSCLATQNLTIQRYSLEERSRDKFKNPPILFQSMNLWPKSKIENTNEYSQKHDSIIFKGLS